MWATVGDGTTAASLLLCVNSSLITTERDPELVCRPSWKSAAHVRPLTVLPSYGQGLPPHQLRRSGTATVKVFSFYFSRLSVALAVRELILNLEIRLPLPS